MSRRRRRPRPAAPPAPVVRVTSPGQVVASVPLSLGYTPEESLVVMCCHEPRGRIGLSFRLDLPSPEHEADAAEWVEEVVREQGATRVVMLVYTEEVDGEERARAGLMGRLTDAFEDLVVTEALLVRGGRFFSYVCAGPCCPSEGRPVDEDEECASIEVLRLERMTNGRGLVGTRAELEQSLAGPVFLAAEGARQRYEDALLAYVGKGPAAASMEAMRAWKDAVAQAQDPRWSPDEELCAALAASLEDVRVRDAIVSLWQEDDPSLRQLLEQLMRATPEPYDAPVCTTYAWITYCEGAGTVTSIALERALTSDPGYNLALLLRGSLNGAVPPERIRQTIRAAGRLLEDVA